MIGASVYVVDKNYRIIYFNEYIKELYPGLKGGEYCYQALCHEDAPCSYCPLLEENRDEALFFNPYLKTWIHINVTDVRWPGIGACHLMVAGRVKGRASHRMHEAALRMAEVPGTDRVGILDKNAFCDVVTTFLGENPQNQYCLVAIDIEHFKLFNEWYGTEKGDCFLKEFSEKLTGIVHICHGFAGYFGNDDFYIFMRDDQEDLKWMQEEVQECFENYDEEVRFLPVFGVFSVENQSLPVSAMCDRARIAAESLNRAETRKYGEGLSRCRQRT
jgi:diguanylate cyclase (GGDEF)-like protein